MSMIRPSRCIPLAVLVIGLWAAAAGAQEPEEDSPVSPDLRIGPRPVGPSTIQSPGALEDLRQRQADRLRLLKKRAETRRLNAAKKAEREREEAEKERSQVQTPPPPPPSAPSNGGETPEPVSRLRQKLDEKGGCTPMGPGEQRMFNFKGDIQKLVKTISELTCRNFIITNKVRSQEFEILSGSPIPLEGIWRAFLSALEANDFTLARTGNYFKIIQVNDGVRSTLPIYDEQGEVPVYDRMVTKIWKLKYATNANKVVNYLNIFKSAPGGQIHPFPDSNLIVATDFGTVIKKLERILSEVDKPGALEQVHVVPVQFASASEIAEKLTQVFEPNAGGAAARSTRARSGTTLLDAQKPAAKLSTNQDEGAAADEEAGPASISKILADDRTNKLIIIASEQAFRQILDLMRELDIPEDSTQGQIHVVRLRHADAEELSNTLASLAQSGSGNQRQAGASNRRGRNQPNQPAGSGSAALFEGDVRVTADAPTNSLVITASKSDFSSMKRVIAQLDVPRFQVFVEAVIMEVSTSNDRTLGASFHGGVAPTINGEQSPILIANTPSQDLSSLVNSTSPLNLASLLGLAGAFRGPTLEGTESIIQGGIPAIGVVIQALQSTNNVNVVSTPHLLTVDNEEAEIQVNEQRPFPSGLTLGGLGGLAAGAGGAAGQTGAFGALPGLGLGSVNFNREDVGLTLKLRPQINDEDYVRLEIEQELSDVAGIDQVTQQVITSKRSAQTVVVVRNQDSVVIGGLVRDRETLDDAKTPLLGDIPLIGFLFKRSQKTVEKVNLVLILTPYIIRGPDDFRTIFERKMQERQEFVNRFYGTTEEFRAAIDWSRKLGPLAWYRQSLREEMRKAENNGPGGPNETIIRPDADSGADEGPRSEPRPFEVPQSEDEAPIPEVEATPEPLEEDGQAPASDTDETPLPGSVPPPPPPPPEEEEAQQE